MRSISRRSILALGSALIAAASIALTPVSVAAATKSVTMNASYSYSPGKVTVALGTKVKWTNNAPLPEDKHDVNTTKPNHLFSSGGPGSIHKGASFNYAFTSAGTFPYYCIFHASEGMKGTVVVPMKVTRIVGPPVRFKITVGSAALPASAPWVRVVQVDLPSVGTHYAVIRTTRAATFKYTPTKHGTYHFRSYLKSTGSAGQSQVSPVASASY